MIKQIKEECEEAVLSNLQKIGYNSFSTADINLYPESSDAVLASNICFKVAQQSEKSPVEIAEDVAKSISAADLGYISKVESNGPYINFYPTDQWLQTVVKSYSGSIDADNFDIESKNVSVEHTSVNPTGPIHMGRLRNSILGDSISNLLEYAGNDVTRQYYVNNAGLQVAVLTWGYNKYDESELPDPECSDKDCDLVRYYRKANEEISEDGLKHVQQSGKSDEYPNESEVISILQGMENGDPETQEMVDEVVDPMLKSQVSSLNELGITFDEFTFESEYLNTDNLDNLLKNLKDLDQSVKSEGAWCLNLGDDNMFVFQRSNGTSLYGTRDLLYHIDKFDRFEKTVLVLGEDQEYQANSINKSLNLLGYNTDNHIVVHHAFVETPEGGMSTRQGEGEFLYEVFEKTYNNALEAVENQSVDEPESVAKKVAIGSIRYDMMSKKRQQLTTYDAEKAVDVNISTGPSIQYAFARLKGIQSHSNYDTESDNTFSITQQEETELLYKLSEYPLVIEEAVDENEPQVLAVYIQDLQQLINKFYNKCPVFSADSVVVEKTRLKIISATCTVLGDCMDILGVPTIEEM